MRYILLVWTLCVALAGMAVAQTCENPSYEGFGAATVGGKGQPIYRVTTLNQSGPGSLREALSTGSRCIVFDVAGEITLTGGNVNIRGAFLTLDGYTAPGPVTIRGYGLQVIGPNDPFQTGGQAHDIVIRGLKFHPLDNTAGVDVDSVAVDYGAYNVVIDGNTFYGPAADPQGAPDEHVSVGTKSHDITISWNLMARRPGGGSTQLLLVDAQSTRVSIHHNLFWDSTDKMPTVVGDIHSGYVDTGTTVDFVNNYIVNKAGGEGAVFGDGARANIVNNFFAYLPAEPVLAPRYRLLITCNRARLAALGNPPDAVAWCTSQAVASNVRHDGFFYVAGNVTPETIPAGYPADINAWGDAPAPFAAPAVTTTSALEGACRVRALAGRRPLAAVEQALLDRVPTPANCPPTEIIPAPPVPPAPVSPPTVTKTLAWDYDGTTGTHFVLEQKVGQQGVYSEVIPVIPIASRTAQVTIPVGQVYCWRAFTALPPFRSVPSNEICFAEVQGPLNLRVQ